MGCRHDDQGGQSRSTPSERQPDAVIRTVPGQNGSEKNSPAPSGTANGTALPATRDLAFDTLPSAPPRKLPPGLKEFQNIFADVAEKAIPAVVSIYSERSVAGPGEPADGLQGFGNDGSPDNAPFQYFFGSPNGKKSAPLKPRKETGLGSGVIISPDGYILTNNHVIEGADLIKVQLLDETQYPGIVVGTDKPSDMAVIRIHAQGGKLPTLPLGDSDKLRIGEWVMAVGNPYGLSHTVTTGIISAKGRKNTGINSYENFLQTDAAINPGNSGGALMNLSGELIGVNTAIFSRSGGYQGIGFAIPINMAKKIARDLIRDGEVTRGWLGVSIQPLDPESAEALKLGDKGGMGGKSGKPGDGHGNSGVTVRGALVGGVVPGGPAAKAGIQRGDVITKVGDEEIQDANDLLNRIALLVPNQVAEIWVIRDGLTLSFHTHIARRDEKRLSGLQGEEEPAAESLGLEIAPLTPESRARYHVAANDKGVVVASVAAGSRAEAAHLRVGDVIAEINRLKITLPEEFHAAVIRASKGNKVLLLIHRADHTFFTPL